MSKQFLPNFKTSPEDFCKEEKNKINAGGIKGSLPEDLRDLKNDDIAWESEQIAKSHGIYLEFDRGRSDRKKDYYYMTRITIPGGGPLNSKQWGILDNLSEKYCNAPRDLPSLRFTTRQNVQFHWIKKKDLIPLVREIASSEYFTLNGCGDNMRNVMACPLSRFSNLFNAHELARETGAYFQLPQESHISIFEIDPNYLRTPGEEKKRFRYGKALLNRKFKIGIGSILEDSESGELLPDNCVELRTNDIGIMPYCEGGHLKGVQIYIGGGQGERNGKPSFATLGSPFAFVSDMTKLMEILDAVVSVHQEWGDRQNRHWARLKYVIKAQGIDWYQDQVKERLGYTLELPLTHINLGRRMLHHGWTILSNGSLSYGLFLENGRINDDNRNGKIKSMVRDIFKYFPVEAHVTANQDLLFTNFLPEHKADFEKLLTNYNYLSASGQLVFSKLRLHSGACVGRDTCRLTYTDSEKFEPELLDSLEQLGWGEMTESIGITGCERQCFRPSTKTIGLVGTGLNRYQLRLMGSEDGSTQGRALFTEDNSEVYLRSIPREKVSAVIDVVFKHYMKRRSDKNESMGKFHQRIGLQEIISYLKQHPDTKVLMEETTKVKAYLSPEKGN